MPKDDGLAEDHRVAVSIEEIAMPSVNFELRDVPFPVMSTSASIKELEALDSQEKTAALQRQFLYMADVLRKCGIPTDNLIAALLGAAIQDYTENAMLQLIDEERRRHPAYPATLTVLAQFMTAQGTMMVNQGIPAGLLGVSMMNAGIAVAQKEMTKAKVVEVVEGSLEALSGETRT
ncbi:hypothetical protein [Bradyrhizobium sp. 27S5]|uniref:hypothetical protein n=1 Tax=Bradyrhizobium sp. 27S5 TaxID=3139728 RepID=UPI0030D53AC6